MQLHSLIFIFMLKAYMQIPKSYMKCLYSIKAKQTVIFFLPLFLLLLLFVLFLRVL